VDEKVSDIASYPGSRVELKKLPPAKQGNPKSGRRQWSSLSHAGSKRLWGRGQRERKANPSLDGTSLDEKTRNSPGRRINIVDIKSMAFNQWRKALKNCFKKKGDSPDRKRNTQWGGIMNQR